MAWMPLNDHTRVKPTYDIYDTVNNDPATAPEVNRVCDRPTAAWSPRPSTRRTRTTRRRLAHVHWHSAEPIAAYLVENSVGHFDLSERVATAGDVLYYEAQAPNIAATRKATNKVDHGPAGGHHPLPGAVQRPVPVQRNGIVVALPSASFEEEMQTKIVFVGGSIGNNGADVQPREHAPVVGRQRVLLRAPLHVLQGGLRATTRSTTSPPTTPAAPPARRARPRTTRRSRRRSSSRFNARYNTTSTTYWNVAPTNPTSANLFGNANTYRGRARPTWPCARSSAGQLRRRRDGDPARLRRRLDLARAADRGLQEVDAEQVERLPEQARRVLQAVVGHGLHGLARRPATSRRSRARAWPAAASMTPTAGARTTPSSSPARLARRSRDARPDARRAGTFGPFTPGVAKEYTATHDRHRRLHGRRRDPVRGRSRPPDQRRVLPPAAPAGGVQQIHLDGPASNDVSTITFKQAIAATDALRTGTYSKTLTFTLSTTTP